MKNVVLLRACIFACLLAPVSLRAAPAPQELRIGVVVSRSGTTAQFAGALDRYLESQVRDYSFQYVLFEDAASLLAAAAKKQIDFAHVTPSVLVELDVRYGATPVVSSIASPRPGLHLQVFGGTVFCPAERKDIRRLQDLRGKRVAAINPHSLGGALAVWRELKAVGVGYRTDIQVHYAGTVDGAIDAIKRGSADCGIAASDQVEEYLYRGLIDRSRIRVLPPPEPYPELKSYPLASSTRLYPAAALAKMPQTSLPLANRVATALLSVEPGGELARSMGVGGWSVPLNYEDVHDCLRDLGVPPYEDYGKVTVVEALRQHAPWAILVLTASLLILAVGTRRVWALNGRLRVYQASLQNELEERKKAESERARLEDQLLQAQKMESIGRLAGGVAHDFNNLLTIINGYAGLLSEALPAQGHLRDYARQVSAAGERAASLTQQLLAFSRKQIIAPKLLDLNRFLADSEKMLRRLVREDIEFVIKPAPPVGMVKVDEGQMHQVLMNLVVNARDAMPNGGKLVIETAHAELDTAYAAEHPEVLPGSYVALAVSDTGLGMDSETRARIFEPFFTTKPTGIGTGLGLSTVYGIVRQSGGWIGVYSEPGMGTTFRIYLPKAGESARPETAVRQDGAEHGGTETILVVEDQDDVRRFIVDALKSQGYRVLEAGSGSEGLSLVEPHAGPVHLLLTDVVMPGMNGNQLANKLKDSHPETRVLYCSGYTGDVIAPTGVLAPGVNCLVKPFSRSTLAAAVRQALA